MPLARSFTVTAALLVLASASAGAQDAAALTPAMPSVAPTAAAPVSDAGPRLDGLRTGAVAVAPAAEGRSAPAPYQFADTKRSRTLMIIGGAALLGGAIIGDDVGTIIMLGGLGVGLYGLWLHLQ